MLWHIEKPEAKGTIAGVSYFSVEHTKESALLDDGLALRMASTARVLQRKRVPADGLRRVGSMAESEDCAKTFPNSTNLSLCVNPRLQASTQRRRLCCCRRRLLLNHLDAVRQTPQPTLIPRVTWDRPLRMDDSLVKDDFLVEDDAPPQPPTPLWLGGCRPHKIASHGVHLAYVSSTFPCFKRFDMSHHL